MKLCLFDITYCANDACPFKDCDNHVSKATRFPSGTYVSVADFSGTCRRYISWLANEERNGKCTN